MQNNTDRLTRGHRPGRLFEGRNNGLVCDHGLNE